MEKEQNSVTVGNEPIERQPIPDTTRLFCTPDLHQAAFLLSRGHRVVKLRHSDRYRFFFEQTSKLEVNISDFHANGKVGIRGFVSAMYSAKRMMKEADGR